MKGTILALCTAICLCSCNFNRMFYQAQPIGAGAKKAKLQSKSRDSSWTTTVVIGQDFQPTFEDDNGKEMNLPFSVESILVDSKTGNRLNCWIVRPKNRAADGCVLFLHGNGGNIFSHYPAATHLAQQGFNVCLMDYSGYGFSTGKATRSGVLADASSVLQAIASREDMKGKKLFLYGQSLGGHLAATVARDNEKIIDAVVVEGAFSSHKDVAAHMAPYIAPLAWVLVREQYSAKRSIKNFHKPVLVVHSPEDETIPYRMGKKIYKRANAPKEFYQIGHQHIEGMTYYADSIAAKMRRMTQ